MGEAILKLEGVCKSFGGVVTAKNVDLKVMPGEIHGLIGPNGAGKSTMMNLISGIYEVDEGKIYFQGEDITGTPSHMRARKGIGRTFQTPRFLYRSNIRDNLMLGVDLQDQLGYFKSFIGKKGSDFLKELDELMELAGFAIDWDEDITAIPFGQRKILEIVRSMLGHPKVMLVDEPAAGLTTQEIGQARDLLMFAAKKRNIGILLIEHQMDLVMSTCENIDVLVFGEILARGLPQEIAANPIVLEAYLGRDFDD
ncbi:ABC transporter ATP-binding protein [Clostridiaceae bacterium]|nr:ABC transporter ATP-binding protein [Clostridiaceae bacterium]RKI13797.1 ABC transporter ATP-binding protein [bacterium 1XD21-70]